MARGGLMAVLGGISTWHWATTRVALLQLSLAAVVAALRAALVQATAHTPSTGACTCMLPSRGPCLACTSLTVQVFISKTRTRSSCTMLETLSYSVSGAMPGRSRYSVSYSASKWSPDAQDLPIDVAIASFAKFGLVRSHASFVDSISHHRSPERRIHEYPPGDTGDLRRSKQPSYINTYVEPQYDYESIASSRGAAHRPSPSAIEYHYPSASRRESVINVGRASHHGGPKSYMSRHSSSSHPCSQRALVPYNSHYAMEEEDNDLAPSDSISQMSTSRHQYHHAPREERRGRTRRRENRSGHVDSSMVSGTSIKHGGAGGMSGAGYQTRILTPFD
ncbi:hypothetical protein AC579_7733 [Pseudocercospora musae]|uniref:Uncharacterized protein n=1 Tax=Pseudocercospora musae TaxID=113226 RepID=A0A139HRF0_9PEZI|nr:hypothetical protein AC579_7733 [Pseudocercospora musae]